MSEVITNEDGIGFVKDYTPNLKLAIPYFDIATWHDYIDYNFKALDAVINYIYKIVGFTGDWKNVTTYKVDDIVFINDKDSQYYLKLAKIVVEHTTNSDDFDTFYSNHEEYYEIFDEHILTNGIKIVKINQTLTLSANQPIQIDLTSYTNENKSYYCIVNFNQQIDRTKISGTCSYNKLTRYVTVENFNNAQSSVTVDFIMLIPVDKLVGFNNEINGLTNGLYQTDILAKSSELLAEINNRVTGDNNILSYIAQLLPTLQPKIDSENKLSSDLVDDTNSTNKFVTASEKSSIANIPSLINAVNDLIAKSNNICTFTFSLTGEAESSSVGNYDLMCYDATITPPTGFRYDPTNYDYTLVMYPFTEYLTIDARSGSINFNSNSIYLYFYGNRNKSRGNPSFVGMLIESEKSSVSASHKKPIVLFPPNSLPVAGFFQATSGSTLNADGYYETVIGLARPSDAARPTYPVMVAVLNDGHAANYANYGRYTYTSSGVTLTLYTKSPSTTSNFYVCCVDADAQMIDFSNTIGSGSTMPTNGTENLGGGGSSENSSIFIDAIAATVETLSTDKRVVLDLSSYFDSEDTKDYLFIVSIPKNCYPSLKYANTSRGNGTNPRRIRLYFTEELDYLSFYVSITAVPLGENTQTTQRQYQPILFKALNGANTDNELYITQYELLQALPTIATSVSSSSTNDEVVGAKLFYDTCGDIETLINAL